MKERIIILDDSGTFTPEIHAKLTALSTPETEIVVSSARTVEEIRQQAGDRIEQDMRMTVLELMARDTLNTLMMNDEKIATNIRRKDRPYYRQKQRW